MKIQVRWIRCFGETQEIVKPAKGGGCRFVTFDGTEQLKFSNLLQKSLSIFFLDDTNSFNEQPWDVDAIITDSAEVEINLTENINDYLKSHGLFASRTWFYLKTTLICNDINNFDEEFAATETPSASKSLKRKICCSCSGTYFHTCLRCKQNTAYQMSLSCDQAKQNSESSSLESDLPSYAEMFDSASPSISAKTSVEENNDITKPISLGELRKRRLNALDESSTFDEKIKRLASRYIGESFVKFDVRKRCLFKDVMQKMKIFFQGKDMCKVRVQFVSCEKTEACVDTGGPSKELFSLLFEKAVGIILQGPLRNHSFVHDLSRLDAGHYYHHGHCVVLSVLSRYGEPHQLCNGLANYIRDIPGCFCKVEDIPDPDIKRKLDEVMNCQDEREFKSLIKSFPERFEFRNLDSNIALSKKAEFIQKIAHRLIISSNMEEIQAFKFGLEWCTFLDVLKLHPEEAKAMLTFSSGILDVNDFKKLFKPEYSAEPNLAAKEEDIVFNFHNFLDEVANDCIRNVIALSLEQLENLDENPKEKTLTLMDVSRFLTGRN